ncbi:YncE family protein [Mariniblastus fucicola]|nr:hypothetical protein [Mariniblastus fucicola]
MAVAKERLFVNQAFGSSILVLDSRTLREITRIELDKPSQGKVTAAPDGNAVYFASNIERAFYAFDPFCTWLKRTPYPDGGHGIGAVVVSPDSRRLYLGIQRGASADNADPPSELAGKVNPLEQLYGGPMLSIYDVAEERYIASKSIGDTMLERGVDSSIASGMVFSNDAKSLFISMRQCVVGVHIFGVAQNRLLKPVAFPTTLERHRIRGCNDVVVHDDKVFVALLSNDVIKVVDPVTQTIENTIDCGEQVSNMAVFEKKLYACQTKQKRILVFEIQ